MPLLPYNKKIVSGSAIHNDGGTVINGGNADTTTGPLTNNSTLANMGTVRVVGTLFAGLVNTIKKANSAGLMGTIQKGKYLSTQSITTQLAGGINFSGLLYGSNERYKQSIYANETIQTTRINLASGFLYNTGKLYPLAGTIPNLTDTWVSQNATASGHADHAANPTRTTPGEFQYLYGSPIPVSGDYSAKT